LKTTTVAEDGQSIANQPADFHNVISEHLIINELAASSLWVFGDAGAPINNESFCIIPGY